MALRALSDIPSYSTMVHCNSDIDVQSVGVKIGNSLETGDVLLLSGDLGAGKTCLSRGIIRSKFQDMDMIVTSPSYLLDNCYLYDTEKRIHHIDLYRLPTGSDLSVLNIPQIYDTSICLIEWPQRIQRPEQLPSSYLDVKLVIDVKDDSRDVSIKAIGDRWLDPEHFKRINRMIEELKS